VPQEVPAILLMEGAGLRRSEASDVRGRISISYGGASGCIARVITGIGSRLTREVVMGLRKSFSELQPALDDYIFTVEVEHWVSHSERARRVSDPKVPASGQALMRMVWRVCHRAGVRPLSPHQLRHGFREPVPPRKWARLCRVASLDGSLAARYDAAVHR
jgi:integrase